jgi:hypothetical protein
MIAQLLASAVLAAGPVPLLDTPQAQSLAVAGDQVIVTRGGPPGRLRVDALAVDGSGMRSLLATPRMGPRWSVFGVVAASPEQVALIGSWGKFVDHGPNRLRVRLYTGSAGGRLRVVASAGGRQWRHRWIPVDVAVDGDRVLVSEARVSAQKLRLRLFVPGAPPRVLPWGDDVLSPLAFAGDHVAYSVLSAPRVEVADLETGTRQVSMKVAEASGVDVTEDGTVLGETTRGLVTAAPGRPRTRVPGSGHLFGAKFAGDDIAAIEFADEAARPVVLDPGAVAPRPIGVITGDLPVLDADPQGVAWLANGCVLYAPVDAVAPAEPPAGPCPRVEVGFEEHDQVLRGRRLRVDVNCLVAPATGCNGTLILRVAGITSRGRFHVAPRVQGVVTVRLRRAAARLVRRRVRRHGSAALRLDWRVPDSRPSRFKTLFVVDRAN